MYIRKRLRALSPYEKNWLTDHNIDPNSISPDDTTPVEYLTGFAQFYEREFTVSPDVLIPRIETEELVKLALSVIPAKAGIQRKNDWIPDQVRDDDLIIVDVGTGSGCIGITLYLELQKQGIDSKIYLLDISQKALDVARRNAEKFKISNSQFQIIKSNLLTSVRLPLTADLIVANLPYIPTSRIPTLDDSVKNHEPHLALDGGSDGLFLIKKLLNQAKKHLKPDGKIILEIDCDHNLADFDEFKQYCLEIFKDQFDKNRFLVATLISPKVKNNPNN